MLYTVQIPLRTSQARYQMCVGILEQQTFKDFELIVADDCTDQEPLKPIKTSFPHRLVRMGPRSPGWAYSLGRNVCIDFASPEAQYLVYVDGDWLLHPNALQDTRPFLNMHTNIHGWKKYINEEGVVTRERWYAEQQILPFDLVLASGGFDEVYFPWYGHSVKDLWRRMNRIRKMEDQNVAEFSADCIGTDIRFQRDDKVNALLTKRLAKMGTKQPILRRTVPAELVYEYGY